MGVRIRFSKSYFWLNSWVLANVISLSTKSFCRRFLDLRRDPCRRLYDQMVMAARSAVANIAEGCSRHDTSIETEMRLTDVARGSSDELFGDLLEFLISENIQIWEKDHPEAVKIWAVSIDRPNYSENLIHDVAEHIKIQKAKFDYWIENRDIEPAGNCLMLMNMRLNAMLQGMMSTQLEQFRKDGGFTEDMTQERLESRKETALQEKSPLCPLCGQPMALRTIRKGTRQGQQFWGCLAFPHCRGVREFGAIS